jgi:hypothetical protein
MRPVYAPCTAHSTFDDYFFAMAGAFCVSGADGGADRGNPDATGE